MKIRSMLAIALCAIATQALAESAPAPSGEYDKLEAWCKGNPDKCEQAKKERRERCAANPEKCEKVKDRREQMREKCQADPEACKENKDKIRERMKERRSGQGAS